MAVYDAIAEAYAAGVDQRPYNALYERPAMLALVGDVAGRDVLDAGCGPGWYAARLAALGARVIAVDASARMAQIAAARLGPAARVLHADMGDLAGLLADASQDLVLCSLAIHYVEHLAPVFAEWARVLRPGGQAVLSTHHPLADQLRLGGTYTALEAIEEHWAWCGDVRFFKRPLAALAGPLCDAGFAIERLEEPAPGPALRDADPAGYDRLARMPAFLLLRARLLRPRRAAA